MSSAAYHFLEQDGILAVGAIGPDLLVLSRNGAMSDWLPEPGKSCFESQFLTGLEEDFAEQRRIPGAAPLILPEMRMMLGPVVEKVTIVIRWSEAAQHFVVLTTRDQMARPIDEWMERRAREQRILEEKIAEQAKELARINHDLQLSNTQLKQFSSVAAHDLQSPLRQVAAFGRLLAERPGLRIDRVAVDYLDILVASVGRMQTMVSSLLHYARLSGRKYEFSRVRMVNCVTKARQNLALQESEAEAQVSIEALPDAWGDPVLLIQLWQNLIANALQYRGEQAARITIRGEKSGSDIVYRVADQGVGIDPEQAESLFEMFRRGDRGRQEGSGIGLSLCMRIVEIHSGRIWFDTSVAQGTCICFTLPCVPES